MWGFASNAISGNAGVKNDFLKPNRAPSECSDDEISVKRNREEGLECPICWESFNIVENVPYVLWCGHTICKNCILGLKWAIVKLPTLPIQLPFFITCPWCSLLSFRLVYKGNIKFPCKNYFLLWMVESMNGDRLKSYSSSCNDHQHVFASNKSVVVNKVNHGNITCDLAATCLPPENESNRNERRSMSIHLNTERFHLSLRKSLVFFFNLTAKFPLVFIFLLIVLHAIPVSAAILALYILITVLFAVPALLVLYFAFPCLNWLVKEIIN